MQTQVLTMPGIYGSGSQHWQTLWEAEDPQFKRIQVEDWDHPQCAAWVRSIDDAIATAAAPVVLVAHSLGCLAVVAWAMQTRQPIRVHGMLLVSVPDPQGPNFPADAKGFARHELRRIAIPGIVVSSDDDPYGAPAYARECAQAWGSRFVNAGALGHINASSGVGNWPAGMRLLASLRQAEQGVKAG
ncbi:RBBP9/YdeN family alpha/beta hydrolase [Noviherbaspirillum saxi]|uniref:Alpha/beta hydrolase n=1 Tax=Noviherbaspirillum saxi TaxID=2320863 RepID=A0A3A3FZK9_9BURK|nr:alpha/beta fold hydrolase [Noviherbaspirillum saxi]RJG00109.1 alpha/beta hydrolase [Noviherbaspirillum saxi]